MENYWAQGEGVDSGVCVSREEFFSLQRRRSPIGVKMYDEPGTRPAAKQGELSLSRGFSPTFSLTLSKVCPLGSGTLSLSRLLDRVRSKALGCNLSLQPFNTFLFLILLI